MSKGRHCWAEKPQIFEATGYDAFDAIRAAIDYAEMITKNPSIVSVHAGFDEISESNEHYIATVIASDADYPKGQ
jgi:hypothetical protein